MISNHTSKSYRFTAMGFVLLVVGGCAFLTEAVAQKETTDDTAAKYPYVIPIETYSTDWSAFQPGDAIQVLEVRGTAPDFKEGEQYFVKGQYTLGSQASAILHVYATGGGVESEQGPNVDRGEGAFEREFKLAKNGMLHVNYYPAGGGSGFGGVYYRKKPTASDAAKSNRDLSVLGSELTVRSFSEDGQHYLVATIRNNGADTTPAFNIHFYRNSLDSPPIHTAIGASLSTGESWKEASPPFTLEAGTNTFYINIDPENVIRETDESNNQASTSLRIFIGGANRI